MNKRILQLDGLRGVAILCVFMNHALQVPLTWMGVDIFFVLSGFLITGILLDRRDKGASYFGYFYARRARRILPPYVIAMALFTLLNGAAWTGKWYFYTFFAMNIAAALHQLPPRILWSLAVEEQFYLFWPFVLKYLTPRKVVKSAIAVIVLAPVLRGICTPLFSTYTPIYVLTPFRMDTLACGGLLAYVWRFHRSWFDRCAPFATALGAVGLAALLVISRFDFGKTSLNTVAGNVVIFECTLAVSVAALMLALRGRGIFYSALMYPALRFIGLISYTMYLVHLSAIEGLHPYIHSTPLNFGVSLAVTIAFASVSWFLVEKPLTARREQTRQSNPASWPRPVFKGLDVDPVNN